MDFIETKVIGVTKPVVDFIPDSEGIISYAARVSAPKNQTNFDTAERLLNYCIKHSHWSVFETVSLTMEIKCPRDIARQILRHRSFCLGADSQIWFDLPNENGDTKYRAYKNSIEYLWDRWHYGAEELPNGQRIPMRDRIEGMKIRCMDEETGEIIHTNINDITKSSAHLYRVVFSNGNSVTSSMDHRYYTDKGWMTLQQGLDQKVKFVCQGQKACKPEQHFPEIDEAEEEWLPVKGWENYYVSNMGRVKRVGKYSTGKIRVGSVGNHGYPRVSFNKPGVQAEENMHRLVMKTFSPLECYDGLEVRHKNHNKLDCRLDNLEWGTVDDNKLDSKNSDTHGRLRTNFVEAVSVEDLGVQDCYDISVVGPYHNFICDGMVVHNSFQEFSQRYAEATEFVKRECRMQDTKNRQNSNHTDDTDLKEWWSDQQGYLLTEVQSLYEEALSKGIAKEVARVILPEGLTMSNMYMNGTLRSWLHYIDLRSKNGTQLEHVVVAEKCREAIKEYFPTLINTLEQ